MSKNRRVWGRCLAAITLCAVASASVASDQWPTQTVRLVVPYATGGTTDLIARKLSRASHPGIGPDLRGGQQAGCRDQYRRAVCGTSQT